MVHRLPSSGLGASAATLRDDFISVVDAGTNLSAPRPSGALMVHWRFSAGVDVGTNGVNIVNGQPGDAYTVLTV